MSINANTKTGHFLYEVSTNDKHERGITQASSLQLTQKLKIPK